MQLAVQLYSVRDELAKDLWGTLRKVRKIGYEGVEFFGDFTHTAQEVAAALEDTELFCVGWHTPWRNVQPSALMSTVTYNKVIGNTDIVIPSLPDEMLADKDACLKTAAELEDIAERLAGYGMCLGYHNHGLEFKNIGGDTPFGYIFGNTSRLAMQLDGGNAMSGAEAGTEIDICDSIVRFPFRARTLHHKPYSIKDGFATMFGEDDIDWPRFFDLTAANQDVEWHIVEYECDELYGQLEGIEKSFRALKTMKREGSIVL